MKLDAIFNLSPLPTPIASGFHLASARKQQNVSKAKLAASGDSVNPFTPRVSYADI